MLSAHHSISCLLQRCVSRLRRVVSIRGHTHWRCSPLSPLGVLLERRRFGGPLSTVRCFPFFRNTAQIARSLEIQSSRRKLKISIISLLNRTQCPVPHHSVASTASSLCGFMTTFIAGNSPRAEIEQHGRVFRPGQP